MKTTVVERLRLPAAAILHVGSFETLGKDFDRLGAWMGENREFIGGAPMCVYVDDMRTTPMDQVRTYVSVPVTESLDLSGQDPVVKFEIPGGRYITAEHVGSYSGLGAAWQQFQTLTQVSGEQADPSRPFFEIYANDPSQTPEGELVTELYQPIL